MNIKFYASLIAINMLIWLGVSYQSNQRSDISFTDKNCMDDSVHEYANEMKSNPEKLEEKWPTPPTNKALSSATQEKSDTRASKNYQPSPNDLNVPEHYLPEDLSFEENQDREYSIESFKFEATEDKMATISMLSNNGSHLAFLNEVVLDSNEPAEVKLAAIRKIKHADNFAVMHTLVTALNDVDENVAANALLAIQSRGDNSVLPILKDKAHQLAEGPLRDEFYKAIESMENKVVLDMDGY